MQSTQLRARSSMPTVGSIAQMKTMQELEYWAVKKGTTWKGNVNAFEAEAGVLKDNVFSRFARSLDNWTTTLARRGNTTVVIKHWEGRFHMDSYTDKMLVFYKDRLVYKAHVCKEDRSYHHIHAMDNDSNWYSAIADTATNARNTHTEHSFEDLKLPPRPDNSENNRDESQH